VIDQLDIDSDVDDNDGGYSDWPDQNNWGDDAMLRWDATPADDDDDLSVNTHEAGLSDGESEWGKDAYLAWENEMDASDDYDNGDVEQDDSDEPKDDRRPSSSSDEPTEECEEQLIARGMPDYRAWETKDLQVSGWPRIFLHFA
jgi:hypothetical protein